METLAPPGFEIGRSSRRLRWGCRRGGWVHPAAIPICRDTDSGLRSAWPAETRLLPAPIIPYDLIRLSIVIVRKQREHFVRGPAFIEWRDQGLHDRGRAVVCA